MIETRPKEKMKATDAHLEQFERFEMEGAGSHPSWLFPIRKAGISLFAEQGFPTLKHENWRFTNLAPIARMPFQPALEPAQTLPDAPALKRFAFQSLDAFRLVFVNGHFAAELSGVNGLPRGAKVGSLAAALAVDGRGIEEHLGRYARGEGNPFAALNTAFFQDGAFIELAAGITLDRPVHLLFVSTEDAAGRTIFPRNLILAGDRSRLTVLESYVTLGDGSYFTDAVSEFVIGEGARVEHCKYQEEGARAFHLAASHAHIGRAANFSLHSIDLGARLSRNNIHPVLDGEGIECVLNGLYLTRGEQLADHFMIVDHAKPHCASHEYYNGILDDRSRGVFHGRILVRQDAQKTDAKQTNKNLLLSDDATVNTKPQLEIYADDVKCTHGATIGQLNEESIFYLRSRGIGEDTARRMLIHAFGGEIIDRVRCEPARDELHRIIWDRLEENPRIAGREPASSTAVQSGH
ncbi:MAG TPA: Fe-S cluster assembly protein SufD [Methylomirabilota bacterium]|nr:Fe-S cluster assembly protein SufD [Methylomirabilota bacterium]